MAKAKRSAKPSGTSRPKGALRPVLLATGLGLLWFAETPAAALPETGPQWSVAAMMAARLVADVVGALVVVSVLRLGIAVVRYLIGRRRSAIPQGAP